MTLSTLNYGNHGIFLIMGNAGFISSTVSMCQKGKRSHRNPKPMRFRRAAAASWSAAGTRGFSPSTSAEGGLGFSKINRFHTVSYVFYAAIWSFIVWGSEIKRRRFGGRVYYNYSETTRRNYVWLTCILKTLCSAVVDCASGYLNKK